MELSVPLLEGFFSNPVLVAIIVIGVLVSLFMPIIKGKIGEGTVNLAAKLRLDPNEYTLLKDVTIPSRRGTTQIDHIILSRYGIFVIETKNYSGWIFGTADQRIWTQVCYRKKNKFQNPLRQNYGHICALAEILNMPKSMFKGVVCFMGDAKFKTGIPDGVYLEGRYINHIKSFKEAIMSQEQLNDIRKVLETGMMKRGMKTNREHVRNLKQRHKPVQVVTGATSMICPACGAEMVKRTARRGSNAGNQFWGCSSFPRCRKIISI